jgi:uncharacterized protein
MNRVVHFEFAGEDPKRAAEFYGKVFGWTAKQFPGMEGYYVVVTGPDGTPGINGGILRHKDGAPRTVNTIQVASLDESTKAVESAGGKVVVPRMPVPGVGWLAYCTDTEGMIFGVHEADPSAK